MQASYLEQFNRYMLLQHARLSGSVKSVQLPAITISGDTGNGKLELANLLADLLNKRKGQTDPPPWIVFDSNLADQILQEHHLPQHVGQFIQEKSADYLTEAFAQLLGLHPGRAILLEDIRRTVVRLASLGNCILIGRGTNFLTERLKSVFHIRLVAPLPLRVERVAKREHLNERAAEEMIKKTDSDRRSYLREYFHRDAEEPLDYHLIINTGLLPLELAARLVVEGTIAPRTHAAAK